MLSKLKAPQFANRVWLMLLLLSPLAYGVGLIFHSRNNAEMQIDLRLDRESAIARAREYVAGKGIDASDWQSFVATEASTRLFYYKLKEEAVVKQVAPMFPIVMVKVLLLAPQNDQNVEVFLATEGQVIGYQRNFKEGDGRNEVEESVSAQLALQALQARPEASLIPADTKPVVTEERNNGTTTRRYKWKWTPPVAPELEAVTLISVRGNQVVGETLTGQLEEQFRQRMFGDTPWPLLVLGIIYGVLVIVIVIFGIFRFTERLRQKEVSFLRILLITASVTAAFGGFVLLSDVSVYPAALQFQYNQAAFLNPVFGLITWGFIGLFIGFAYGSGEGDLRELYPGKLTSLDALLTGKLYSRNVAQAVIHGVALSGWLFVLSHLLIAPFVSRPGYGWRITSLEPFYANSPWLSLLLSWFSFAVLSVLLTFLLPLPLLQRRVKNRWIILGCLLLIAFEANSITQMQVVRPWGLALMLTLLAAVTLLLAFFKFDVLTAIVALSASDLIAVSYTLLAKSAPAMHRSGLVTTQVIFMALLLALWAYFKGHLYREDEVRPMYARNLAERLSLQAEVSAAREAQIRLMPDHLPQMPQLTVAAVCQPAYEVGGDFYDLFELDSDKLGIFMAEGGGRGLPAALTIAFAKGFLMPKIKRETLADDSPTEIVRGLQTLLARTMSQDEVMGFVYAVIDTSDHTLRYAGVGDFPRPYINGRSAEGTQQGEETEITFSLDPQRNFRVTQGFYSLAPGDTVSLLSDGAVKLLSDEKQRKSFWENIAQYGESSYRLRDALASVFSNGVRFKNQVADDLTAVVVRMRKSGGDE